MYSLPIMYVYIQLIASSIILTLMQYISFWGWAGTLTNLIFPVIDSTCESMEVHQCEAIFVYVFFKAVVLGNNTEILFRCHSVIVPQVLHHRSFVPNIPPTTGHIIDCCSRVVTVWRHFLIVTADYLENQVRVLNSVVFYT